MKTLSNFLITIIVLVIASLVVSLPATFGIQIIGNQLDVSPTFWSTYFGTSLFTFALFVKFIINQALKKEIEKNG